MGGSSGGAKPKVFIKKNGEEELILVGKSPGLSKRWMVKTIKEIEEIVFTELGDILKSYR